MRTILVITVNVDDAEFCCGRATGQLAHVLGSLVSELTAQNWKGITEIELPLKTSTGRICGSAVAKARVAKYPPGE